MSKNKNSVIDLREQTFNQGEVGPMDLVSTPVQQVRQLHAIMIDIDLKLFRRKGIFSAEMTPDEFYRKHVVSWLQNDPVLSKAEVQFTGSGFHAILWFTEPVLLRTVNDAKRWNAITKLVQASLPSDPKAPGINSLTRPIGSVNSKNGQEVCLLKEGSSVTQEAVCGLAKRMLSRSFTTILRTWFGSERVVPCPVCRREDSYLEPDQSVKRGRCYKCRKVTLVKLIQSVLTNPIHSEQKGENHA